MSRDLSKAISIGRDYRLDKNYISTRDIRIMYKEISETETDTYLFECDMYEHLKLFVWCLLIVMANGNEYLIPFDNKERRDSALSDIMSKVAESK